MLDDVEYILDRLSYMSPTSLCIISANGSYYKIARMNYSKKIELGVLYFESCSSWLEEGYSVFEVMELLNLYGSSIKDIEFRFSTATQQKGHLLNVKESKGVLGSEDIEYCVFTIEVDTSNNFKD